MNEKHRGNGFWAGLVVGILAGSVALFASSTPEGKKRVKKLLVKGESLLDELNGKNKMYDLTPHFEADVVDDRKEKIMKAANTAVSSIQKRFFKKSGKKLSFW